MAKESYEYVTETAAWVKDEISLRDEQYEASLEKRPALEKPIREVPGAAEGGGTPLSEKAKLKKLQEDTMREAAEEAANSPAAEYMKKADPPKMS